MGGKLVIYRYTHSVKATLLFSVGLMVLINWGMLDLDPARLLVLGRRNVPEISSGNFCTTLSLKLTELLDTFCGKGEISGTF